MFFFCLDSSTRIELAKGEALAVILNNLGGTSKLEERSLYAQHAFYLENLFFWHRYILILDCAAAV
jgi:hypothetical protein